MTLWLIVLAALAGLGLLLSVRIVQQYERGVLFRLGRVTGTKEPGLTVIVPVIDVLRRVSLRIVTMPIQSQGIITRDNVSVDVSAVAYYRVVDAVKSVVAIENVAAAINQIAQTTLRKVVGQHTLDETLAETDRINASIREILDVQTADWGVVVTLVELKDIQLPESMKRAMARQAEAEREKRAKIIAAEGESLAADALGTASDIMMAHPLALQLRIGAGGHARYEPVTHRWLPGRESPDPGGVRRRQDVNRKSRAHDAGGGARIERRSRSRARSSGAGQASH